MREIKELIPLSEARKLIGAQIELQSTDNAEYIPTHHERGQVISVDFDDDGDLEFQITNTHGTYPAWISRRTGWHVRVLSESETTETPRERVERLKSELAAAEQALVPAWVPDDWTLYECPDAGKRITSPSGLFIEPPIGGNNFAYVESGGDSAGYIFLTLDECHALTAWVAHNAPASDD